MNLTPETQAQLVEAVDLALYAFSGAASTLHERGRALRLLRRARWAVDRETAGGRETWRVKKRG